MKREQPSIESLASLDSSGSRKAMIPLEVKGFWSKRKAILQWILLFVFLATPWLSWNGNPLILLNLSERKFSFFGYLFFAHDGPLIFFILAFLVLALILVTSIWGRVWCGYACPQTVFIERVYRKIEGWIEGSPIERRKKLNQALSFKSFSQKAIKWFLFFIVSSLFAHSFAAYFVGADSVVEMIQHSPLENWTVFLIVSSITALLLFDFGWFREQFCIIMCPYGRFQSVLMDDHSLAVIYDEKRGEPRKGVVSDQPQGDCVSCFRCVEVCPTGIDIRQGVQMECIACTACIDACDEIMTKVKKPKGLIRYDNVARKPIKILKPRNLIYIFLLTVLVGSFVLVLSRRNELHVTLLRAKDTPYQVLNEKTVLNHFKLHIKNQSSKATRFLMKIEDPKVKLITQINPVVVGEQKDQTIHFFAQIPLTLLSQGSYLSTIRVLNLEDNKVLFEKPFTVLGPKE